MKNNMFTCWILHFLKQLSVSVVPQTSLAIGVLAPIKAGTGYAAELALNRRRRRRFVDIDVFEPPLNYSAAVARPSERPSRCSLKGAQKGRCV